MLWDQIDLRYVLSNWIEGRKEEPREFVIGPRASMKLIYIPIKLAWMALPAHARYSTPAGS